MYAGLSMNILHTGNKLPMQRDFFKIRGQFIACPEVSGQAACLLEFCNYIFFNVRMICRRAYFTDSEMIEYYQKSMTEIVSL